MEETVQVNIRIPNSLLEDIDFVARRLKINRADWIRMRIAELVAREKYHLRNVSERHLHTPSIAAMIKEYEREYVYGRINEEDFIREVGLRPSKPIIKLREQEQDARDRGTMTLRKHLLHIAEEHKTQLNENRK